MSNIVNYPKNPTIGQEFMVGNTTKYWDGEKWANKSTGQHERRITKLEGFETVQDLRDNVLKYAKAGDVVEWHGYYHEGDGGGNTGILKFGDSTSLIDDGGSVFVIVNDATNGVWVEASFKGVNLTLARFGANNTGVNVTDRVQAAIDYAQANNRPVSEFSDSEMLIDTVTVARADETTVHPLTLKGSGWSKTVFKAASAVDQMFLLEGSLSQSSNYNHISNVYLKGELKAKSGIKSSGAPNLTLRDVRGLNFTGEGLFDLENCWASTIDTCKSSFNIGANAHGARLRNTCFGTNIISSFFFANDGWGLIVDPSISISISGGIEANKKGGLHASGVKGLNVDGLYTEGNGSVGDTLMAVNGTHPPILFKCDILLNGTSSYNGTYVSAFPCEAVSIRNLTSQITTSGNTVIEVVAVNGLQVDLVKDAAPTGPTKNLININVVKDNSTAKNIDIGTATGYTNKLTYYADESTSRHGGGGNFNEITFGRQYNLVNDPTSFSYLFDGSSGNIPQIVTDAGYKYKGLPIYSLEIGSVGESNWFGEILDMDDANNEWLRGKLVHVDLLVKTKGSAQVKTVVWPLDTAAPLLSDAFSSSDFAYSNNTVVVMPNTGFVRLGFQLTNVANISTDTAEVAKFIIAPLGVDVKNL